VMCAVVATAFRLPRSRRVSDCHPATVAPLDFQPVHCKERGRRGCADRPRSGAPPAGAGKRLTGRKSPAPAFPPGAVTLPEPAVTSLGLASVSPARDACNGGSWLVAILAAAQPLTARGGPGP